MALPHAQPLDVIDVRPLDAGLRGAVTSSLLKTPALQLMRLVLRAGHGLPQHSVPGAITIHCRQGDHRCGKLSSRLLLLPGNGS